MKVFTLQCLFIFQFLLDPCFGIKKFVLNIGMGFKSPDCVEKAVVLINGQFPGPEIRVTASSMIEVKVCFIRFYDFFTVVGW